MAELNSISADRLKELLCYDQQTGIFTWNKSRFKCRPGDVAGDNSHRKGYIQIRLDYKKYYAHRLAWLFVHGTWPSGVIDHINGITSDNRIANLRDVTQGANRQNQKTPSSPLGVLGVCFNKRAGRYVAQIMLNRKHNFLGYFDTPEEARNAYLEAKRLLHPYSIA